MSLWLVRAGAHGEQEQGVLENSVITIHWNDFPDLSKFTSKDGMLNFYFQSRPNAKKTQAANEVGEIWSFAHDIQKGDLAAVPLKGQSAIAIGEVKGDYEYTTIKENIKHVRQVKWLKKIPRGAFDQDILYMFGTLKAVCQISKNNAEARAKELLQKEDFLYAAGIDAGEWQIDIEQYAKDEVIKYVSKTFSGHGLARLVEAVLKAQGLITERSGPGPDGGIGIFAVSGSLGFDYPRICVQVKPPQAPVDVKALKDLRDTMAKARADHGLIVSWGGFTQKTIQDVRDNFFSVRLWDSGDLLQAVFNHYDRLDGAIKAELPLKKIWGLAAEE